MTHQNHQTNGASLEDCHTNFFALTELYGIKWRKLVWGETASGGGSGGGDGDGSAPLADPVISSYARCLAGDILCVWRRVPTPSQDIYDMTAPAPPPLSLRAAKELWIFWYGEEPDLNGLVAPELISGQGEQGSWESGLSYECRSLLFKALHNLIERCLLSRDFVRLGKWFVQPYDGDEDDVGKSPWHLSFSFAFFLHGESTVCASVDVRQHPPVRSLCARRRASLAHQHGKVILAPFGLEGTITGREWSDTDPATGRLLDAWRQLYPLEQGCGAVEVMCGGVRMRYPSPYVLETSLEAGEPSRGPPAGPGAAPAAALPERALRALTLHNPHQASELCQGDTSADIKCEDIVDPTRKTACTCAKWRRRRLRHAAPFHRRAMPRSQHAAPAACSAVSAQGGTVCSPGSCGGGSPAAPVSAPSSAGPPASPQHTQQPNHQPSSETSSVKVLTAVVVTTPTVQGSLDSRASQQLKQSALAAATLHTPAPTPDPLAPPTPAPPSAPPAKPYPQGDSPAAAAAAALNSSTEPAGELLQRPVLPVDERAPDPLEDEHSLHMLYDYTTVHAWLEHPVKRFKTEEPCFREEMALGAGAGDLYAGHEHTKMAATPRHSYSEVKHERQEEGVKEYKKLFTSNGLCATLKDLDQIFDNSDDASGDETVRLLQVQTPPDSNKSVEDGRCSLSSGGRGLRAEELSKMFPTPPSMEPSPGFTLPDDPHATRHTPPPDPIEDWSYVFKPPTVCKYVGSSKYAPLTTLPSQLLPAVALPPHAVYRPRWLRDKRERAPVRTGTKRPLSPLAATPRPASATPSAPNSVGCRPSPAPSPPSPRAAAAACPLLLNVLLADTVLNVFRDHNFDSCTLCVCNAGPKSVGNIRGADAATYLPRGSGSGHDEEPGRCTCGFSAVVNRRLAHRAGLFYEDEMEITGLAEEPWSGSGGGGGGGALREVAGVVLAACGGGGGASSALERAAAAAAARPAAPPPLNLREYSDGGCAAALALRAAGAGAAAAGQPSAVHRWPFIGARGPRSSRDVVRLMRRLRPLLQDAIQKRCCGARMWDGVTGPLTWRQFHRLAGRGNEDLCEPQPVPPLLVGHDRDWLSLSPYALRHWERLALEPYAYSRDVAYVVLAPDCEALTDPLRTFFRELSTAYEACRLGRHQPIHRINRDGLIRTSPSERDGNCEEWMGELPPGRLGEYVKAYADVLQNTLIPQLGSLTIDKTLFETEAKTAAAAASPSPEHPATPGGEAEPEGSSLGAGAGAGAGAGCGGGGGGEEGGAPALVVYVVEPPPAHAHRSAALLALLRLAAYAHDHHLLQPHNPVIKIISLEGVLETCGLGGGGRGELRALAFSVFSGARRMLQHTHCGKSLTGFGTAADTHLFLKNKDEKNRAPYALFSPAWVLAPQRALKEVAETWGTGRGEQGNVLFLSYCLSHDQRWLLAAASDARGELRETAAIDIHVPHRSRWRRAAPARRLGLTKLMDFILGVMSQSAQPWRLVVGRVGRIGHGELKGWSYLLSRRNLCRASNVLREICGSCSVLYPGGVPCILSACLVSTEPDSCLRLMADRFTPDERFSQASIQSHLHTPRDVTATHILVFPTSATTQSNQMPFEQPLANGEEDLGFLVDIGDEDGIGEDNVNIGDLFIGDMFNNMFGATATEGSPRRDEGNGSREGSPARHQPHAGNHHAGNDDSASESVGTVLQQPLALGYLVSTAPLGAMPAWWWAGCAHLKDACPAFLKNALHLHAGTLQSADDFTSLTQRQHHTHPLDSQLTTDVLRYVLEGYNALSWLALDGTTHDRLSCLPIHVQVLMQLYHTAAALG